MLRFTPILCFCLIFAACKSTAPVVDTDVNNYSLSDTPVNEIVAQLPNYSLPERGVLLLANREIVSEPLLILAQIPL